MQGASVTACGKKSSAFSSPFLIASLSSTEIHIGKSELEKGRQVQFSDSFIFVCVKIRLD